MVLALALRRKDWPAERVFLKYLGACPTAKAEDPCRSEGILKDAPHPRPLRWPPLQFAVGARRKVSENRSDARAASELQLRVYLCCYVTERLKTEALHEPPARSIIRRCSYHGAPSGETLRLFGILEAQCDGVLPLVQRCVQSSSIGPRLLAHAGHFLQVPSEASRAWCLLNTCSSLTY